MCEKFKITLAPNGARRQKTDHPNLPISPDELADTASACFDAGSAEIHLHVRDKDGLHSLDPARYRDAIAAIKSTAPEMAIQITTESAGVFAVDQQDACLRALSPDAASIAIREMARDLPIARRIYARAAQVGTRVQHILYSPQCVAQLAEWRNQGVVQPEQTDVIFVLGGYEPPVLATPGMLAPFLSAIDAQGLNWTVCAFGRYEHACLLAAIRLGGDVRVGFENNLQSADGQLYENNQASVRELVQSARLGGFEPITKV